MLASLHVDLVVLSRSEPYDVDTAAEADALPIINGGSRDDHPTQAMADLYTLQRELSTVDGKHIAVVGRLEHRNVNALLMGLALFDGVRVTLMPLSGQADPEVVSYCEQRGLSLSIMMNPDVLREVDAIYLNGPRTLAHAQLLRSRRALNLRIDDEFLSTLRPHCVILDPMQRSSDFDIASQDPKLAFYRQARNALLARMALLSQILLT